MEGFRAMRLQSFFLFPLVFVSLGWLVCGAREDGLRFGAGREAWHHENFEKLKAPVLESAHSILHYRTETPLQVPLEVNVVLVGFSKNGGYRYHLDEAKLENFLHLSYPSRRPSCLETNEQLEIEHPISFNVIQADTQAVLELERALRKEMVRTGGRQAPGREGNIISEYTVEATSVEPSFDRLYEHYFNMQPTVKADRSPDARPPPTAIFVFNFDKVRMDPANADHPADRGQFDEVPALEMKDLAGQEAGYLYHYRYMGGAATQTWIAAGRYMVVDLSAGPCQYGRLGSDEGSISRRSIPRLHSVLQPFFKNPTPPTLASTEEHFQALLSSVIVSAIEYVIAPDVQFESLDVTHRVLVPVVALRNHHLFHPLRRDDPHAIDISAVEREVTRLVQPDQEVVVVGGMHSLHEHEHLALAVSKAMRSDSLPDGAPAMHFQVKTRDYLDGEVLMDEFRHSSDMLAAGLLDMTNPDLATTFFYHDYASEMADSTGSYGVGVVKGKERDTRWRRTMTRRQARSGSETASEKKNKLKNKKGPEKHVAPMYGTRVVPVFVLSLAGVDSSLLMDGESALETAHDAIIVLQTPNGSVPVSYMSEDKRQLANTADPTREIIAGIAGVLGGIASPFEKVSKVHQRREENWMWANGHHPFGPFSNCTSLSAIMVDVAHRNSIYSKVDVSLHGIRESLDALQAFADKFFATPLGSPVAQPPSSSNDRAKQWIDLLYTDSSMPAIMSQVLLKDIEGQLNKIEEELVEIGGKLYDHQLDDAHTLSEALLEAAHAFHIYVTQGLQDATDEMRCCSLKHKKPIRSSSAVIYAGILFAGFIVYFLVIYFASPER